MGTFQQGIDELKRRVGDGDLTMSVVVDQPYAVVQHEKHFQNFLGYLGYKEITTYHAGGGDKFLERPLLAKGPGEYMQRLADHAYEDKGLERAMVSNAEDLSQQVHDLAPRLTGALRDSAHPTVTDNGAVVYDRPPVAPRVAP
jgi:hypothetical protein